MRRDEGQVMEKTHPHIENAHLHMKREIKILASCSLILEDCLPITYCLSLPCRCDVCMVFFAQFFICRAQHAPRCQGVDHDKEYIAQYIADTQRQTWFHV